MRVDENMKFPNPCRLMHTLVNDGFSVSEYLILLLAIKEETENVVQVKLKWNVAAVSMSDDGPYSDISLIACNDHSESYCSLHLMGLGNEVSR